MFPILSHMPCSANLGPARPGSALLIRELLTRVRTWAPEKTITYRDRRTLTYTELLARIDRLGGWLRDLGIGPDDRVGVMDWDSHRYLELFFAVPMSGAVLHTVNVRLTAEQVAYTIQHARDTVLLVHRDFLPLLDTIRAHLTTVRHFILLQDELEPLPSGPGWSGDYEAGLAGAKSVSCWPDLPEDALATLFYTTGTTGQPKGVGFSHRQIVLHTLSIGLTLGVHGDPINLQAQDVYLPLTPMFHVHAWGIPYLATMLGMTQVYPGRFEPATLLHLLERHHVTFSHCVPTVLQMLLHHPDSAQVDWSRFKVMIGGAALQPALANQARARGIRIAGGYGMSETCPIVAISHVKPALASGSMESQGEIACRTGFPLPLVQATILDGSGQPVEAGETGELVLRSPWLTQGYLEDPEGSERLWRDGWMHTGDGARIDSDGYIRITDRLKDTIKIGGEWISSLEIEAVLGRHPAVKEVAVIGVPDKKWDEHPRAEVVLRENVAAIAPKDLLRHLHTAIDEGHIHKRAVLTEIVFVPSIPRTSVGKIDKKRMRAEWVESSSTP